MRGPFAGMQLLGTSLNSAFFPKIVGSYEKELHPLLNEIARQEFELLINVGAGEGFYTVGFLRSQIVSRVVCFESDPKAPVLIKTMASMNGVSQRQIDVYGNCTNETLRAACKLTNNPLLLVDVEGYEAILLDPLRVPELTGASILVETHDCVVHGITDALIERFSSTHRISRISGNARDEKDAMAVNDWFINLLPAYCKNYLVTEFRPQNMEWFWMQPLPKQPQ